MVYINFKNNEYCWFVSLKKFLNNYENEVFIRDAISRFKCSGNDEVHKFFVEKSLDFEKYKYSKTYLYLSVISNTGFITIFGFVTLSMKPLDIFKSNVLSKNKVKSMKRNCTGMLMDKSNMCLVTLTIGQVGRSDLDINKGFNFKIVEEYIGNHLGNINRSIPIMYLSLECKKELINFYESYGYHNLGMQDNDGLYCMLKKI